MSFRLPPGDLWVARIGLWPLKLAQLREVALEYLGRVAVEVTA